MYSGGPSVELSGASPGVVLVKSVVGCEDDSEVDTVRVMVVVPMS